MTTIQNEGWEEPFHRANVLLGDHRSEEAREVLRAAKEAAIKENDARAAAFYSSVLGSFLASEGDHRNALKEYEDAERYEPGEVAHRLRTARLLMDEMAQSGAALQKIESVVETIHGNDAQVADTRDLVRRLVEQAEHDGAGDLLDRARRLEKRLN
jgi:tetratricopeptide (TPR) repeat protein